MTNYSSLLADNKIRSEPAVKGQVRGQLAAATRDLKTAHKLGAEDAWAFSIAYNAMLHARRAVMFSEGYRPTSGERGHVAVVEFLRIRLDSSFAPLIDVLDRMRRQRHRLTYESEVAVSKSQTEAAIRTAANFVDRIEAELGSTDQRKPKRE